MIIGEIVEKEFSMVSMVTKDHKQRVAAGKLKKDENLSIKIRKGDIIY